MASNQIAWWLVYPIQEASQKRSWYASISMPYVFWASKR
jgi:hypothetical protein